jgi:demethylmenaquinone methyltransferase/2-methoxy-6-polyprenyl-1,4-benzoquinol methylase
MAAKWDTICKHDTVKINNIISISEINKGAKILDVGTGTGILIPFLRQKVGEEGEITAIDVSENMLEVAQRKYTYNNVFFVCKDVLQAGFPNEYYDFIICYSVFPHFNNKETAITVMAKYLKMGGKFIICHSQSRETINNLHKDASEAVAKDNLPSMEVIKGFFRNMGLKTITEIDNNEMFVIIAGKQDS